MYDILMAKGEGMEQGFIITSDWVDVGERHFLRFMGRGTMGPFEFVLSNFKPYFYVDRDAPQNLCSSAVNREATTLKSFDGKTVDKLSFKTQGQLLSCRRKLGQGAWACFEADLKPTDRYLMDHHINGAVNIIDAQDKGPVAHLNRYLNPCLEPCDYRPNFKVLSLDIETSKSGQVISIGLHLWDTSSEAVKEEVLVLGDLKGQVRAGLLVLPFDTEKSLLEAFSESLSRMDPDIIIGWNVIEFDLNFLMERCRRHSLEAQWGRLGAKASIRAGGSFGKRIHMNGRLVIDGPNTLRAAFYQFENFKLETVAQKLLGRGKDIDSGGWDEIERRYREDSYGLAFYNIEDCRLVAEIFKSTGLLELQATRSRISGLLMGQVGRSTAAFDHFFMPACHEQGLVAFNIDDTSRTEHSAGGHVLEPTVGLHEHVIVLDFKSLYPSIINTFKIDPISRLNDSDNAALSPSGHHFSQVNHALPKHIQTLLEKRQQAKKDKDGYLSQAIKILMNSFYGVMGSGGSRFYHPDLPTAITGAGRWILKEAAAYLEDHGYTVIYGDTDSVFVKLKEEEEQNFTEQGDALASALNEYFDIKIAEEFKVQSYLEIEFEKYFSSFFLPPSRSKEGGSKKRYAGLLVQGTKEEIHFAGLEFVRSDWTRLAKDFQYELMRRTFYKEPVDDWIRSFVRDLKRGKKDEDLIYKKRLTKKLEEYTKSRPPHVKAALQLTNSDLASLGHRPSIEYLMTPQGPIPLQLNPKDIDYEHYVKKQIQPIADSVLWVSGKAFEGLVEAQRSLFGD